MLRRKTSAGGTADLYGFEFSASLDAAADIIDHLAQGSSHGNLNEACVLNGAGDGEGLRSGTSLCSDGAEPVSTLHDDTGHIGEGLHIVQDCGFGPESLVYGSWRFNTGHTSVTFDGSGQGRTFTADECTGTAVDMHMEAEICSQNVISEQALFLSLCNGVGEPLYREGVFRTYIDITVLCIHCIGGYGHTFDQTVGVTFHNASIHECARVTLVAVTDNIVFFYICVGSYLFPFLSGGESAAASSAQAGFVHFVDDISRRHVKDGF